MFVTHFKFSPPPGNITSYDASLASQVYILNRAKGHVELIEIQAKIPTGEASSQGTYFAYI